MLLGKATEAARWDRRAQARNAAIHRYLWRAKDGVFADYDFAHAQDIRLMRISHRFIPCGPAVATREEAKQVVDKARTCSSVPAACQ